MTKMNFKNFVTVIMVTIVLIMVSCMDKGNKQQNIETISENKQQTEFAKSEENLNIATVNSEQKFSEVKNLSEYKKTDFFTNART
ncbi:MAG: hypothetical protein FWF72_02070 [Paludibacter sp.]|nr:hypothetical protein [Paludibacter sp.]